MKKLLFFDKLDFSSGMNFNSVGSFLFYFISHIFHVIMNYNLNEDNTVDYIFEDIPFDDNSLIDTDDFDGQDYL